MKRLFALLLAAVLLVPLVGCGEVVQDESPLTMFVGLGNSAEYYTALQELIEEKLGFSVQYVYYNTLDTTGTTNLRLESGDLPADIVITAARVTEELQEQNFIDLSAQTNATDLFSAAKIREQSVGGAVYQLPFATRLIGVGYNKTLFEEMGWDVPSSMDEMLALKEKAEAAGYPFAVSGGAATGHGFNYLFHLMGTEYLCTPDGAEWLENYLAGETTIDAFAEKAEYFKTFAEAGLFGSIHAEDWHSAKEFCQTRALFHFNITSDAVSYDGFRYLADGTLAGAEYNAAGEVVAEENPAGNAVCLDGVWTLYDEENEAMQGLTRYEIAGAQELHDRYAAMPWPSSSGGCNCFTTYDNMFVSLNKKLAAPEEAEKLQKAEQVLTLLASDEATRLFTDIQKDGFVAVSDFDIDESRLYYDFRGSVNAGYLMEWYYNRFDADTIVNVGGAVNAYLAGEEGATFENILEELDSCVASYRNGTDEIAVTVEETLDFEEVAEIEAVAAALSVQETLDAAGVAEEITAAVMPYTESVEALPVFQAVGVVQTKLYAGELKSAMLQSLVSNLCSKPVAVRMTGAELQALVEGGYRVANEDLTLTQTFPYVCMTKDSAEIDAEKTYLVALPQGSVESAVYEDFLARGAVLTDGEAPLTGTTVSGLALYFAQHPTVAPGKIAW